MENQNLLEILDFLDPVSLDYQDWVNVGMALKHEGFSVSDWDAWSSRDRERYHSGECYKKWKTFNGSANPVTAGTIVQMAKEHGWNPHKSSGYNRELEWDAVIGAKEDLIIVDKNWIESREISEPSDSEWSAAGDLVRYLETLFESTENVGYVTQSYEKDGKHMPTKGVSDRTAGKLIQDISKCGGDIGAVLGDYNRQAGHGYGLIRLTAKALKMRM